MDSTRRVATSHDALMVVLSAKMKRLYNEINETQNRSTLDKGGSTVLKLGCGLGGVSSSHRGRGKNISILGSMENILEFTGKIYNRRPSGK